MLSSTEQLRARFAPGMAVRFKYRSKMLKGTITRTNLKRAHITCADSTIYQVPYERLLAYNQTDPAQEDKIRSIQQEALDLLAKYQLTDWQFKFDDGARRAGCCNYRARTISISFELARSGEMKDIRDTLLHELAHALVGKKHNHDAVWKAKAKEIGCSGERTHRLQFAPPRWTVRCENNCWTQTAERRNSKLICKKCRGKLIYTPYQVKPTA